MPKQLKVDYLSLVKIGRQLLVALGEDPRDPRLVKTPERFARAWREFIEYDPGSISTAFKSTASDQIIVVSGIKIWSMCEHHLLPFNSIISVGYLPNKKLLGLSKFARIAHKCSHKLQLQERLVVDIADEVTKFSDSKDVAVLATGEHLCMSTRGIRTEAIMSSSVMRGVFRDDQGSRLEFMTIAKGVKP